MKRNNVSKTLLLSLSLAGFSKNLAINKFYKLNTSEMRNFQIFPLFFILIFLFSCTRDNDDSELKYDNLKTLEIGEYEMQVPDEFILVEGTGFDSYVGTIEGYGIELRFDYGSWNDPPQPLDPAEYEVRFETFGSVERYIVIPRDLKERTGIHIRDLNKIELGNYVSLNMAADNLSREQQNLVVKILESVYMIE